MCPSSRLFKIGVPLAQQTVAIENSEKLSRKAFLHPKPRSSAMVATWRSKQLDSFSFRGTFRRIKVSFLSGPFWREDERKLAEEMLAVMDRSSNARDEDMEMNE